MNHRDDGLWNGLAPFEAKFFRDLIRSYATLDISMRRFFYHRIQEIVKEAIALLRERQKEDLAGMEKGTN